MQNLKVSLVTALPMLFFLLNLEAATTATATVTYSIGSIDSITVSGNPGPLNVTTASAGSDPTTAIDASTTYAVTTNNTAREVDASLASNMPDGVTLSVNMAAPTDATSAGSVSLTTTPICLIMGISSIAQGSLSIVYTLSATVNAAPVTAATNTVTYTIGP